MPSFPIVDSHVHLYNIDRLSYPWLDAVPQIRRSHLPVDFDRARGPVEVDKIVFAEVDVAEGRNIDEAKFVAGLAEGDRRIQGIIACGRVERGAAVREELDALVQIGILRGIRRLIQGQPDPEFCLRPAFIEGVQLLPGYGLPFDVCILHHQLPNTIAFLKQCPDVLFVIDHIAKPGIKNGFVEPWKTQIREIAAMPNTVCKISGVVTEADHRAWTPEQVRPYVEHIIDCFGFDRVLFGGDWPVLELAATYPRWVEIVDGIVAGASQDEKRKLYRDTAIRVYRLPA
jgi:L-fuconolactonase